MRIQFIRENGELALSVDGEVIDEPPGWDRPQFLAYRVTEDMAGRIWPFAMSDTLTVTTEYGPVTIKCPRNSV